MDDRYFKITGMVNVTRDEVAEFLAAEDDDYQPTDEEWLNAAYRLLGDGEICWIDSELDPIKRA